MAKSSFLSFKPKAEPAPAPVTPTKPIDVWETDGGATAVPDHESISKRAYELYLKSGRQEGRCRINWEQAEQELMDEQQKNRSAKQGATARGSADLDDE